MIILENVLFQNVGDEMVILNIASGDYYGLNEVGSRVWTLLQEGKSVSEILDTLRTEYDIPEENLQADIHTFLAQLESTGLIRLESGPQA